MFFSQFGFRKAFDNFPIQALGHAALAVNRKLVLTHIASPDLEQETKVKVSRRLI
jgi:hypothetical protein